MKFSSVGIWGLVAIASGAPTRAGKVHRNVHRSLQLTGSADILISFKDGPQAALNSVDVSSESRAREDRVVAVVEALEQHAQQTQKEVLDLVAKFKAPSEPRSADSTAQSSGVVASRSFWLTNQVWIAGASADFVKTVSALPSVAAVVADERVPFTDPVMEDKAQNAVIKDGNATISAADDGSSSAVQWGITKVRAPELWTQSITGTGVVVGSIDTGVRGTHEALASSFRGDFGWYDAITQSAEPFDDVGHGTHTVATMVGQNGYGVAPGATWMACKACDADGCLGSNLVACAEWMTCPTSALTGARDCTKAPHVINNSWGGGKNLGYFSDAIDGWRKAGIIPVFSSGNEGPGCGTVSSPADLATVISVGATDRTDLLASFSSKGPGVGSRVKPDLVAPGALIRSAVQTADNAYGLMSGTSMAAPHVCGVVALMLSQNAKLTFDQIASVLKGSTEAGALKSTGANCGGINENLFPNNAYGAGRMDAVVTLQKIITPAPAPAPVPVPTPAPTLAPAPLPVPQPTPAPTQAPAPAPTPVVTPAPSPSPSSPSEQAPYQQRLPTQQQLQWAFAQALALAAGAGDAGTAVAADVDLVSDVLTPSTLSFR